MKKFWSWFRSLNPMVQIVFIVLVAIVVYFTWKWIKKKFRTRGQVLELSDISSTITALQNQGLKASFPQVQYSTWANQLAEAFNGCGTSNQVWRNVFNSVKNNLDIALLTEAYGVKEIDECNWEFNFGDFKGTLSETLVHELDADELTEIKKLLESKGITYSF